MLFRTDNPERDFLKDDNRKERELEKMPVCLYCGEHIQDDFLYEINDEVVCEECIKDNFRKQVEDYVE